MATYVEWNDSFSVGYGPIDAQHQELLAILNELYGHAMSKTANPAAIDILLDRLIHYTETHFAYEEKIYCQCGVPDMDDHIRQHQEMIHWARGLALSLDEDSEKSLRVILNLVADWLVTHILKTDQAALPVLRQAFGEGE